MIRDGCFVSVDGDLSAALKAFKRQVETASLRREMRRRACYSKPSETRKVKSRVARARNRKAEKRQVDWLAKRGWELVDCPKPLNLSLLTEGVDETASGSSGALSLDC